MKDEGLLITDEDGKIKFASVLARDIFLSIKPESNIDSLHDFFDNIPEKISELPLTDYHIAETGSGPFRLQFVPLHNTGSDIIGYMVFLSPLN